MHLYTQEWYRKQQEGARPSARAIVPLVLQLVRPKRVVDVGCGVGTWLSVFREWGIDDVVGIDGDHVAAEMLEIPADRFITIDLKHPFRLDAPFDLVVSLEVAEHLPPESAEDFVESLTTLGPVILFSAAIPLQGGEHHVNEQWPDYWAGLFQKRSFVAIDCLRKQIWQNEAVEWWYAQNILTFAREDYVQANPALKREAEMTATPQLSLVHPRRFLASHRPQLTSPESRAPAPPPGGVMPAEPEPPVSGPAPGRRSAPFNERSALRWSELRQYLGVGFRPEWLSDCGHPRSGTLPEQTTGALAPDPDRRCPSCLYALTAREMSGDVDASCALLRRLVPAPARVLEYGCGIGAAGLRLLDDGYHVHFANGSGPNTRYLRWRLARRGLDAPISDPQRDPLPQVDVAICGDVLESTVERQGLLRSLESLGDLVIATFIHHDPEAGRTGQISRGLDGSALLGDLRRRYPVIATECAASKAGSQLVTVAYFTGIEHPMASRKLCAVDWSAPSLVSEQTRDSPADVLWLLEGGEPNEASARWHAAFHQRRPERYAVAIGPTWPHSGALNLSVKKSFLLSALQQVGVDGVPVDAAAVEAALALAGARSEPLHAACVAQAAAPALEPPTDCRARAVWLGSSAGRAAARSGALSAAIGELPAPDLAASVLVIGAGDDPQPLLQTLAVLADGWCDDWELVLVSRYGSACETATLYLEGDFRLVRNPEPVGFDVALNQAALAARGQRLLIPTPVGPLWISREPFLAAGGARGFDESEVLARLSRWAEERLGPELTRC